MSGLVDALVITAVAGLVIARQFRAGRLDTDGAGGSCPWYWPWSHSVNRA